MLIKVLKQVGQPEPLEFKSGPGIPEKLCPRSGVKLLANAGRVMVVGALVLATIMTVLDSDGCNSDIPQPVKDREEPSRNPKPIAPPSVGAYS